MSAAAPLQFATLAGYRVIRGTLSVPGSGAWVADVVLDVAPADALTGLVTLRLGDLELVGTVVPSASGAFVEQGWYRVVAGAAGWSRIIGELAYHNDLGIDVSQVVLDAAAEVGESVGSLAATVPAQVEGVDFVRERGPASRVFGQVLDAGSTWWVDFAGVTHIGARLPATPDAGSLLELLDYHPAQRVAIFAADNPASMKIGLTVTDPRLAAPITVRAFDVELGETLRIRAWVQESATVGGPDQPRILRALRAIVRETFPRLSYLGLTRYRVVSMVAGRASLQIVNPDLAERRLPDQTLVKLAPGAPGLSAVLTPGAIVLVTFADGDPSLPVITHFASPGDPAFRPVSVELAGGQVKVGPAASLVEVGRDALLADVGRGATLARVGHEAALVQLSDGSETLTPPEVAGRVVRYGDQVQISVVGAAAVGVLELPAGPHPVAKVQAS